MSIFARFETGIPTTSLRTSLILRVLLPALLVLGGAVFLGLRTIQAEAEARMQEDVEMIARAIRLPVTHAMERDQDEIVSEALRSAFRIRRVYGAYVYGPDGVRRASMGAFHPDEDFQDLGPLVSDMAQQGEYGSMAGRRVYSYFVPLTDSWGRNLGLLQVTRLRSDIDSHLGRFRAQAGTLLLACMALMVILILRGHQRSVGEPLARLREGMRDVKAGNRARRVEVVGPHELAEVGRAFNSMLDALKAVEDEVEERREAQEMLRKDLIQAEKMAAVGVLSAGVAHELGTPLTVIDGKARRALRQDERSPEDRRALQDIRDEVRRMDAIVRQLLAFGRSGAGTGSWIRLDGMVRAGIAAVSDEYRRKDVTLEMSGAVPGPWVHVNQRRMEQAVGNLLRNAFQAAAGHQVRVGWSLEGDTAVVEVEDSGPGIPEVTRTRIFEPFFTTKAPGDGTGLGLAIVHAVAEEHGGRVSVDTSPLGGARFRMEFPRGEE
ncbi:MAG: HAMP domain-containing sensor histidine kinase [Longimicrobiales bacterium]